MRDKEGLAKKVYTRYNLVYSYNMKFILASQKKNLVTLAYYIITMDSSNMSKKAVGYMGKLRGYNSGTEYNLYDGGDNPKTVQMHEYVRNQLAGIKYVNIEVILGTKRRNKEHGDNNSKDKGRWSNSYMETYERYRTFN
jgi:hypothetical protein